MLKCVKFC